MEWVLFIMAIPVYFFAADLFHCRMLSELVALWLLGSKTLILRRFYHFGSMDMLISLGTTVAYFSSITILGINATQPADSYRVTYVKPFFDSVVLLLMFLMIGRLLEAYSKAKAGDAVSLLDKLRLITAVLFILKRMEPFSLSIILHTVLNNQLQLNNIVSVANSTSPPYNGIIIKGIS